MQNVVSHVYSGPKTPEKHMTRYTTGAKTWHITGCQAGWSAFNGKCYKSFSEKKTWDDAKDQCVNEEVRYDKTFHIKCNTK